MKSAMEDLSSICRLYMLFTKMDWKPRHRNSGTSSSMRGCTTIRSTVATSVRTFFGSLRITISSPLASRAGFAPKRITEPKMLTARSEFGGEDAHPSTMKRMEVAPFQPGPPVEDSTLKSLRMM